MKKCSNPKCEMINPQEESNFNKCAQNKDGLQFYCKNCRKARFLLKRKEIKIYKAKYYLQNKTSIRAKHSKYQIEKRNEIMAYRLANKEKVAAELAKYKKSNAGKVNARNRNRQLAKVRAMPNWLTEEQKDLIQNIYIRCDKITKETGIQHHIDHIVPLLGRNVRGFHVPWNLQILPASGPNGNLSKSNKFNSK